MPLSGQQAWIKHLNSTHSTGGSGSAWDEKYMLMSLILVYIYWQLIEPFFHRYKWIPMECDTRGKNSVYYVDVIAQEYWVDTKVLQWSINPFWVGLAEFDFYLICMHWELIPDDPVKNNDSKAHIGNTVYCNQPSKQSS